MIEFDGICLDGIKPGDFTLTLNDRFLIDIKLSKILNSDINKTLSIDNFIVMMIEFIRLHSEYNLRLLKLKAESQVFVDGIDDDYGIFLRTEGLFCKKVLKFVESCFEINPDNQLLVLFDLDETLIHRSGGMDYLRPSFVFIWSYLKNKYKSMIDFGILTSRGNEFCLPDLLSGFVNSEFCFSTREGSIDLSFVKIDIPSRFDNNDSGMSYLKSKGITDNYGMNGYLNKAYCLHKLRDNIKNFNVVAIDDLFNYGKVETLISKSGIGLGVFDCVFNDIQFIK